MRPRREGASVSRETLEGLERRLRSLGLPWDGEREGRWRRYLQLFEEWAERVNLVSRRDRSEWVERHALPSLALLEVVRFEPGAWIADVGSGGGFPGIPLALARDDCFFVLIESKRWRSLFLQELVDELALTNVEVVGRRVEELWVQRRYRGKFQYITARGVADLTTLWTWTRELLAEGGELLAYKGPEDAAAEAGELQRRAQGTIEVRQIPLQGSRGTVIVAVRKTREGRWPRYRDESATECSKNSGI